MQTYRFKLALRLTGRTNWTAFILKVRIKNTDATFQIPQSQQSLLIYKIWLPKKRDKKIWPFFKYFWLQSWKIVTLWNWMIKVCICQQGIHGKKCFYYHKTKPQIWDFRLWMSNKNIACFPCNNMTKSCWKASNGQLFRHDQRFG